MGRGNKRLGVIVLVLSGCSAASHDWICSMGFEELNQGAVNQGCVDSAKAQDQPHIASCQQAEDDTDYDYGNIAYDPGKLEGNTAVGHIFDYDCSAVVGGNTGIGCHIKGDAKSGEEASQYQRCQSEWEGHMDLQKIFYHPADEICQISYGCHIDNGSGSDAVPCLEEDGDHDSSVGEQLACTEGDWEKFAHSQIHAGEGIGPKFSQTVQAYTDSYEENPY